MHLLSFCSDSSFLSSSFASSAVKKIKIYYFWALPVTTLPKHFRHVQTFKKTSGSSTLWQNVWLLLSSILKFVLCLLMLYFLKVGPVPPPVIVIKQIILSEWGCHWCRKMYQNVVKTKSIHTKIFLQSTIILKNKNCYCWQNLWNRF